MRTIIAVVSVLVAALASLPAAARDSSGVPEVGGIIEPSEAGGTFVGTAAPNQAIADNLYNGLLASMACSAIPATTIPAGATVTDVRVQTTVEHPWIGDLVIKLVSPEGTVLGLMSRPGFSEAADDGAGCCGSDADLVATHPIAFHDDAVNDAELMWQGLTGGQAVCRDGGNLCEFFPNPGAVTTPPSNLAAFAGESAVGAWRLCVGDAGGGSVGQVKAWQIEIDYQNPDPIFASDFEELPECSPLQLLGDPSFEATNGDTFENPFWSHYSDNFNSVFCTVTECGNDAGSAGPRTGNYWVWLGGTSETETAWVEQSVVIPAGMQRQLNFWMWMGWLQGIGTTVEVRVDGAVFRTYTEPTGNEPTYVKRTVDLSAYADGEAHTIRIQFQSPGGGAGATNISVDDVTLDCGQP